MKSLQLLSPLRCIGVTPEICMLMVIICLSLVHELHGQDVFVKRMSDGKERALKKKTILTFEMTDSDAVIGRIHSATDSSLFIERDSRFQDSGVVELKFSNITKITNELMNTMGLGKAAFGVVITGIGSFIKGGDEGVAGGVALLMTGTVFFTPYLIKKRYRMRDEWTIVVKNAPTVVQIPFGTSYGLH